MSTPKMTPRRHCFRRMWQSTAASNGQSSNLHSSSFDLGLTSAKRQCRQNSAGRRSSEDFDRHKAFSKQRSASLERIERTERKQSQDQQSQNINKVSLSGLVAVSLLGSLSQLWGGEETHPNDVFVVKGLTLRVSPDREEIPQTEEISNATEDQNEILLDQNNFQEEPKTEQKPDEDGNNHDFQLQLVNQENSTNSDSDSSDSEAESSGDDKSDGDEGDNGKDIKKKKGKRKKNPDEDGEETEEPEKPVKEKIGFKDKKIIEYENRIRNYSTPDKIFRYFATYKSIHSDGEIFMTPEDFLRSLTPGVKQPEGLGLDQFKKFDPNSRFIKEKGQQDLGPDSIFYALGSHGLISFSDYIFLLTILSTSRRQFEIAFRMFDLNGDGDVDAKEFEKVQEIIRQTTSSGKRHRDHSNTGNTLKRATNSALSNFFFGEDRQGKLTIDRFLEFQTQLQHEILTLEFNRKDPEFDHKHGVSKITEKQFAELLLTYADYNAKKRAVVLKRVKKAYKKSTFEEGGGITLEDYMSIFNILMHIEDIDRALSFHNLAGASINRATLKHVAKVCCDGIVLSDHLVDVIFTIFDEDGDGGLSNKEFVGVMKGKLKRGLDKPKETGMMNLINAVTKCALGSANEKLLKNPPSHVHRNI